ncbi:MAG TPA: Crp/Fnr family transcriptional regulator [Pedobacter sp.]
MDHSLLLRNIARYVKLDKQEEEYLIPLLQNEKVKSGKVLLEAGELNSRVIFVTRGCLRSYALDENGSEHVFQFAPAGSWLVDMPSFITQEPARLNISAIENSEIIYLLKSDFDTLHLQLPKFERFGRVLTINGMISFQHHQIDNVSLSPTGRYMNFCRSYPLLIDTLPPKEIASYIGITVEALAKIPDTGITKRIGIC